ncbi:MAG TPA: NADH-quinone oxidoreductase subunit NuoH [Planctomycetota bacterium]|nr:NADH-quinone oxidoreductase subunit NuoH [Planctomycetota bacterium]
MSATLLPLAGAAAEPGLVDHLWKVLEVVIVVHALLILGAVAVWAERRVSALIQDRRGPNRVGPLGLLQSIADLGKFIFKEDVVPGHVHKWMYVLAPAISLIPSMVTFAVIPYGPGRQVADLDIGILYVLGVASLGVYGITLGGWASNSKYALLGGVRSAAQMVSYEVVLGISAVGVLLMAGTLHLNELVAWQAGHGWFVFHQPLGFALFLTAAYAETNRLPFDLPEAESELVAGYHTEYSSMKFALFFLAEYTNMIVSSALVTTLFLGGWSFFGLERIGWVMGVLIFSAKTLFLLFVYIWVRWTLPRFRYDQLMSLCWKWMFPLSLANVLLTAAAQAVGSPLAVWATPVLALAMAAGAAVLAQRRDAGPPPELLTGAVPPATR